MKNLFAALSKAQSEMGKARKDSTNPHFKSKYADLESCVDAVHGALAANGLAYVQRVHDADKAACVETIIMHESGEMFECGKVSVPVSKIDAQGYGSALTYARRYSLSAAFGLATEDDDGNAATKARPQQKPQEEPVETLTIDNQKWILDACGICGKNPEDIAKAYKVGHISKIPAKAFNAIKLRLEDAIKAMPQPEGPETQA